MKIGIIEFAPEFLQAGAALTGIILLAVTISVIALSGCATSPVREKVIPHQAAKTADPYRIGSDDELEIIVWTQPQLSGKVTVAPPMRIINSRRRI